MDQVLRCAGADRRERAHLHQRRTVPVEHDDLALGVERDAESHAAGAAHGAHLIEVLLAIVEGEQLAPAVAGGGDHRGAIRDGGEEPLEQLGTCRPFAALREILARALGARRQLGLVEQLVRHRALRHDEGEGQGALLHLRLGGGERVGDLRLVGGERAVRNAHGVEQLARDLAHQFMLRLVVDARLAAPGDDHHGRDAEREVERGERVHRIAETRVLAHHHGAASGKPGAGGDRHRLALARRADIGEGAVADHPVDHRGEERARHAGIEIEAALAGGRKEIVGGNRHGGINPEWSRRRPSSRPPEPSCDDLCLKYPRRARCRRDRCGIYSLSLVSMCMVPRWTITNWRCGPQCQSWNQPSCKWK